MAENENSVATGTVSETAKPKSEPVISQAIPRQKIRFVIVTEGQGGANVGAILKECLPNNPYMIAINTSQQDLDQTGLPNEQTFVIGSGGAGKDRDKAKQDYKDYAESHQSTVLKEFISYYEEKLFHPETQTIILSVFSSDGGTGSGIGPEFTKRLGNYVNTTQGFRYGDKTYQITDTGKIPRPVAVGLTMKCSRTSGEMNLNNTIGCFADVQEAGKYVNIFIADNNLPSNVEYESSEDMYRIINSRIVIPLMKFLGIEMNSSLKCMDLQDKIKTLRIPGFSSFISVSNEQKFQYVIPRGQSCKRVVEMLKFTEDGSEERAAKQILQNYDIMSRDMMKVFFEPEKISINNLSSISKDIVDLSMIGLFGYESLSAVVEDLRANLHRIQESNVKKAEIIKSESTGFASIKEDNEAIHDAFSPATLLDDDF